MTVMGMVSIGKGCGLLWFRLWLTKAHIWVDMGLYGLVLVDMRSGVI